MKYEFRINGTTKLVLIPEDDLEKILLKRIFAGEQVKIEVIPNSDEVIIHPEKKK
jgi:hypothetical protein